VKNSPNKNQSFWDHHSFKAFIYWLDIQFWLAQKIIEHCLTLESIEFQSPTHLDPKKMLFF
jgi:hypothetical protein